MSIETTDKVFLDANQDKPRIIYKTSGTITTDNIPVAGWVYGGLTIYLNQLKISAKNVIDIYVKDNQTSRTYRIPVLTCNSSNQYLLNITYDITGFLEPSLNNRVQKLSVDVQSRGGSTSDTFSVYVVVYSTRINESILIDNA